MAKMYIAVLLEFYQPPTQTEQVLKSIANQCYFPLVKLLNCDLDPKFSISLTNSLVELLERFGLLENFLEDLKMAYAENKIEIVHTGAFHPIFPLIPHDEVKRQIELDIGLKGNIFGQVERKGVISPELSYDDKLLALFQKVGFKWTLVNDKIMAIHGIHIPSHEIYTVDGFAVFLRSSFWSDQIRSKRADNRYWTGKEFVQYMNLEAANQDRDSYKVISLTAETFGHHLRYFQETFLRDMLFELQQCKNVKLCFISDLLKIDNLQKCPKEKERGKEYTYFPPSSIATDTENVPHSDPYPHWKSNGNKVHEKLWALTDLVINACKFVDFDKGHNRDLRDMLDKAFYSGQYFSASIWYWKPNLIYEGIDLQMRALYKYCRETNDFVTLRKGQKIYRELIWDIYEHN
jgi:alpha-amylase/alpha-mannosidase (GH57 family)